MVNYEQSEDYTTHVCGCQEIHIQSMRNYSILQKLTYFAVLWVQIISLFSLVAMWTQSRT